jgi:hypothetical protein
MKYHRIKIFTDKEIEILAANKFTARVTKRQISYTLEFQNLFLAMYDEQGKTCCEIFTELGYDVGILGKSRVHTYPKLLREKLKNTGGLRKRTRETVTPPTNIDYNMMPSIKSVAAMQHELLYLRQQLDFLKKITDLDNKQR